MPEFNLFENLIDIHDVIDIDYNEETDTFTYYDDNYNIISITTTQITLLLSEKSSKLLEIPVEIIDFIKNEL